ncbi:hypothetical protein J2T09_000912 [Neorhizobium huautlense]|uniref:Uncharacterized protein n=1 Tax=Neorhizobium huautlense TaxID=67774 RepID=A0ABT9PNX4_9HYPH|nr:hypothetical protein [Neorhizobium huautlense]MDP9836170.1 hypothetical protein [Neorhizobium huautlense]
MNEADNASSALIAYGSYAPGGENHARLAFFAGEWRKGFVLGTRHTSNDDIGPGEDLIDAWVLEFPRPQADGDSPEYQAWARRLADLWSGLDQVMGAKMVRDSRPWWPEGTEIVVGAVGMKVATIYLPLHRFADRPEPAPQPQPEPPEEPAAEVVSEPEPVAEAASEEAYDLATLWRQTFTGENENDHSQFITLIQETQPDQFAALFADLPDNGRFVERLKRLFSDHLPPKQSIQASDDANAGFHVHPLVRNARPLDVLVELARRDIAQRAGFLRARGKANHAEALENLTFVTGKPEHPEWEDAGDALDAFADEVRYSGPKRPSWHYCLKEACHGIAADYVLQDWLMLFLLQPDLPEPKPRPRTGLISRLGLRRESPTLDLEPAYSLWKAGGRYEIDGKKCCVYEVERREG